MRWILNISLYLLIVSKDIDYNYIKYNMDSLSTYFIRNN